MRSATLAAWSSQANEYLVPIGFIIALIILAPLAFHQVMRETRPHSKWFTQNRKAPIEARDTEPPIMLDDLYDAGISSPAWSANQCSDCGKFRKAVDLTTVETVSHDRLESWWEPVCRVCRPKLFVSELYTLHADDAYGQFKDEASDPPES